MFFAERQHAIEDGERISHGAVAEAGDAEECVVVGFHLFVFDDLFEMVGDALGGDIFEVEALAS